MKQRAASKVAPAVVTLEDRLTCGNLTVAEVCALAGRSRTGFYEDVKAGRVAIRKAGRKTLVPGPAARRYIAGETNEA